jgi:hypothetical protein
MKDQQDINPNSVSNQVKYPLDYVSQEVIRTLLNSVYPIGCIFTTVSPIEPNVQFGFGTWSSFGAGRVPVGYDSTQTEFDTVGETGGAKTHTLDLTEIPSHSHGGVWNNAGGTSNMGSGGGSQVGDTGAVGGGQAHNNLQPYIVVYMWKRES